jgi:hypothetical protein
MPASDAGYHAFLLRLRRWSDGGRPVWRFTLEQPGQDGQLLFSSLEELHGFLLALVEPGEAGRSHNEQLAHED